MRTRIIVVIWIQLMVVTGLAQAGNSNSLYIRAEEEKQKSTLLNKGLTDSNSGNGYGDSQGGGSFLNNTKRTPILKASWITVSEPSPKDFRVHDLITIVVHEVSKNSTKADTKAEREYTLDASLQDWLRLSDLNLRPDKQSRGDPKVGLSYEREFEGKGDIKREDTLSARIQAKVIDVLPNGNLMLEATKKVSIDEETTTIVLSGICRSKDVGIDNSVLSSQVSDLDIRKYHKGIARDATKRGLLSGLVDWLSIF